MSSLQRIPLLAMVALLGWAAGCGSEGLRVVPTQRGQGGGELIRVEGHDFAGHGPPVVYVGNLAAKAVVVESDRLITALTPQIPEPAEVEVKVAFADGTELDVGALTITPQQGLTIRPRIVGDP